MEKTAEAIKLASSEAQLKLVKELIEMQPSLTELYIATIYFHIKCFHAAEAWRKYCTDFFSPKK